MSRFFPAALAALLTMMVHPANVATVTYEYYGSCVQSCEDADLDYGASAKAKLVMDTTGYDPDGFFGVEALVDFEFSVGDFYLDRATAPYFNFGGPWEVIPGGPTIFYLSASASESWFPDWGDALNWSGSATQGGAWVSRTGACLPDPDFPEFGCQVSYAAAALVELAPIPVPATLWLMAAAMTALGATGLKRRLR